MSYVIATSRNNYRLLPEILKEQTGHSFYLVEKEENLTFKLLDDIKPKYIFFPHWSYIIPQEIYNNFECVIFHMTDVPFGRGGSPLQNLVSRGIYETKISALRCVEELDAGPVYFKRDLCLNGTAEEIFLRASKIIQKMIIEMVLSEPIPQPQVGEVVSFIRRIPAASDISNHEKLEAIFDHIRMLDADGYPAAFIETDHFRFEFSRAGLKSDYILADVKIFRKHA